MSALEADDVVWDLSDLLDGRGRGVRCRRPARRGRRAGRRPGRTRGAVAGRRRRRAGHVHGRPAALSRPARSGRLLGVAAVRRRLTDDPARGALMQRVQERATAIATRLLFFELEWAEVDDEHVDDAARRRPARPSAPTTCASMRRYRPHLLTEPEERMLTEKSVTGRVGVGPPVRRADLGHRGRPPDGAHRRTPRARALEPACGSAPRPRGAPGRGRARSPRASRPGCAPGPSSSTRCCATSPSTTGCASYPSWISCAEPVQRGQRRVGAGPRRRRRAPATTSPSAGTAQGPDARPRPAGRLRPHGVGGRRTRRRSAGPRPRSSCSTPTAPSRPSWPTSRRRFFDERWIDAPVRPGKRPGAFCAYTVPVAPPLPAPQLDRAGARDVLTLAHELGHGLHAYLAREQGVFHQSTPLTLAETASVFGETVTIGRAARATPTTPAPASPCWPRSSRTPSPPCSARSP